MQLLSNKAGRTNYSQLINFSIPFVCQASFSPNSTCLLSVICFLRSFLTICRAVKIKPLPTNTILLLFPVQSTFPVLNLQHYFSLKKMKIKTYTIYMWYLITDHHHAPATHLPLGKGMKTFFRHGILMTHHPLQMRYVAAN